MSEGLSVRCMLDVGLSFDVGAGVTKGFFVCLFLVDR